FVNTLAMRNQPGKEKTFKAFLAEVKENSLQAYDNQSYQLEELIRSVQVKREPGRNPMFDVMFDMNNIDSNTDVDIDGLIFKQIEMGNKISKFDLSLKVFESNTSIEMILEYSTLLFKNDSIIRAAEDIQALIEEIVKDNNQIIKTINILNNSEKASISEIEDEVNNLRSTAFTF
ncbi:condensation domain-containing protein, partial [Peribacillus simplex]|uniref:condensation domain-containing protein n=1 Tax=Peribacillus simplex TaxID=1478 RepID=UPI00298E0461